MHSNLYGINIGEEEKNKQLSIKHHSLAESLIYFRKMNKLKRTFLSACYIFVAEILVKI